MATKFEVTVNSTWNNIKILVFLLYIYVSVQGNYTLIPVGKIEKGFIPSAAWFEGTSNKSMAQEETQQQEKKEKMYPPYLNNYMHYPSPPMPGPNPWAPTSPPPTPPTPPPPPPNYSVVVSVQIPEAFILLCQVEEPLEHISWLWYPCPNHLSASDGVLIADGTTVSNSSLYGVRILGQNGVYISELHILQNPLLPGVAGLYRCEAWPHGAIKDTLQQYNSIYHDEFIIGGQLMIKNCFIDTNKDKYYYQNYGSTSYGRKLEKSYRTPRITTESDLYSTTVDGYNETVSPIIKETII